MRQPGKPVLCKIKYELIEGNSVEDFNEVLKGMTDDGGECPHDHTFGDDCDKKDECDDCDNWDACIEKQEKDE